MYACATCPEATRKERRCGRDGFEHFKHPRFTIGPASYRYQFCPGKATWFPEIAELFEKCELAMHTGVLPGDGSLLDQDEAFVEVFPVFVSRWKERTYDQVWDDVRDYVEKILTAIFGKK